MVGIDEAGLGPRLGPLVVTRTAFIAGPDSLETALAGAVSKQAALEENRLRVDDSKLVYRGGRGFAALEKTALAFWQAAHGAMPCSVGDLLTPVLAAELDLTASPWYGPAPRDLPLPLAVTGQSVADAGRLLAETCRGSGVRFSGFRTFVILEPLFNRRIAELDCKAHFLGGLVLDLIGSLPDGTEELDVEIFVDKLGGRNRYGELLGSRIDPHCLEAEEESRALSRYTVREKCRNVTIRFVRSGDRLHMPVALASIFSKYVREIFMNLFNTFWKGLQPGIRPTAGYPVDATRFLDEITRTAEEAGIDMAALVRQR